MEVKAFVKSVIQKPARVDVLRVPEGRLLEGRVLLVTGGTSGIGLAAAGRCAACGARVVITGRGGKRGLSGALAAIGGDARAVAYDAASDRAGDLLDSAAAAAGALPDLIFANAGIYTDGPGAWDGDEVDRLFAIDFHAVTELVNEAVARWTAAGVRGTVVVTGSNRGLMPDSMPYGAAKAALHSFVQGVARDHFVDGIRANVIAPGWTATGINGIDPEGDLSARLKTIGSARVIRPEEIAEVALFLLSDRSSCVNGAVIPCDLGDSLR